MNPAKIFILALLLACIMFFPMGCSSGGGGTDQSSFQGGDGSKVYVASGHPEWWPIMYRENDRIIGVGADLTSLIANDLGLSIGCRYTGTWDTVLQSAREGEIDLVVAAYKTAEREQYMDFSDAYTTDPIAIYVKSGQSFPYEKWADLAGKRGVVMTGDSYGQDLDNFIAANLTVVQAATSAEAFGLLSSGRADYFFYSYYAGTKEISSSYPGQYEALPKYAAEENFYMAISKKSSLASYMPQINEAIARYKNNGTIKNLMQGYFQSIMVQH